MNFPESFTLDPAEIAKPAAKAFIHRPDVFDNLPEDTQLLNELDQLATDLKLMHRTYWVESTRSLSLPVEFDPEDDVRLLDFRNLSFEGFFTCYAKVQIGRIIGGQSVRALCLTFNEATLLPYMEQLPDDYLLYVPVYAVNHIDSTDFPSN